LISHHRIFEERPVERHREIVDRYTSRSALLNIPIETARSGAERVALVESTSFLSMARVYGILGESPSAVRNRVDDSARALA